MENLDLLTDEELRLRLVQYGFPNLPVTQTTRKVLIKKLRTYLENEKSKLRRETNYATRYSSGEESDNDVRGKLKAGRKPQGRSSVPVMPQSNVTYKPSMPPPLPRAKDRSTISISNTNVNKTPSSQTRSSSVYVSPVIINDSEDETDYSNRGPQDKGIIYGQFY